MNQTDSLPPDGFARFGLHSTLLRAIEKVGYTQPRSIQEAVIPAAMEGRDVMGLAQTGTGKTAAFALPILDALVRNPGPGPRVLVLAPTRELASQIAHEFNALGGFTGVKITTVFGGVSPHKQIKALRHRPQIVVGCPGRVLDLLQQGVLPLDRVETLVLDEADHMFDMGFFKDIRKILQALPRRRQNQLFSATMPKEVRHLAEDLLHDPLTVEPPNSGPVSTIDHALLPVVEDRKRDLLLHLLGLPECSSAIVFTRTKHRARRLATQLASSGFRAVGLQGNMSQSQRDRAMKGFRDDQFNVLVATDIVARGIDVTGVSHVINFDVPNTPEAYTHRIGRTGRAEREGVACTFVTPDDRDWVRDTERMIGSPIRLGEVEGFELATFNPSARSQPSKPRPGNPNSPSPARRRRPRRPAPRA